MPKSKLLKQAIAEIRAEVSDAVDFIATDMMPQWAESEKYFAGKVDAPDVVGRSTAVKTVVRDTIRALRPSVMRVLMASSSVVEYIPSSIRTAAFAEQQGKYVQQLFNTNDGYMVLYSAMDEAFKKKIGPIKTYWEPETKEKTQRLTGVSFAELSELLSKDGETYTVLNVEPVASPSGGESDLQVADPEYFNVTLLLAEEGGRIRMEAFPANEFFASRDATRLDLAFVHGHRRTVTVAEAMLLGLDADWDELGLDDDETDDGEVRRGRQRDTKVRGEVDITTRRFTLTECYVEYDLSTGAATLPTKWCFWLGGPENKYIAHYEVDDWAVDLVIPDPVPFELYGLSVVDVLKSDQDTMTSLFRIVIDSAHAANNPRIGYDPTKVNTSDLLNNKLGVPIRMSGDGMLKVVDIPFVGQQLMPLLDSMSMEIGSKIGVTRAAQGLDPDAMQSTDKQAVQNTIQLSQGQVELMVRNIIETGLIPVFKRLLRLSVAHMPSEQVMMMKGALVPIDVRGFDTDLAASPNVGMGTTDPQMKVASLQFILQKQEAIMAQFGLDNPFTSLTQIYNTIEDLVTAGGIHDVGRHFKVVTPEVEQLLAKKQAEEAAAAQEKPKLDPVEGFIEGENIKARIAESKMQLDATLKDAELEFQRIKAAETLDLARDKMVQDRGLALLKLEEEGRAKRADAHIARAQQQTSAEQVLMQAQPTPTPAPVEPATAPSAPQQNTEQQP